MTLAPDATAWLRKFSQREAGVCTICSLGDSYTEPVGATWPEYGWTALTARDLGRRIADDQSLSSHSISVRAPQSVSQSGAAADYDARNPHVIELANDPSGDGHQTFYDLYGYSSIDVIYLKVAGTYARPQYAVSGGTRQDFTTTEQVLFAPGSQYCVSRIEGFPGGNLDIFPPNPGDGPAALVFGLIAHRGWTGDRGVRWINWARSGWSSLDVLTRLSDWLYAEPVQALGGDLLHLGLGGNDIAQAISIPDMKQNYRDIIGWFGTHVNAQAPVMFTTMPWPDLNYPETTPPTVETTWNEYMDAIVDVAAEYPDSIVVDWRGFGPQSQNAELYLTSDEHFNNYGHRWISDVMSQALRP